VIIWLASYPRSGNTLLRTVFKRCLGLDSYADEEIHVESPIRSDSSLIGHRELPASWDSFYEEAARSSSTYLVKTHLLPRDDQRYVYVVRDGRSAVKSYRKYYERYVPGHRPNLYQLIAGDDAYGDWSGHYDAWVGRESVCGMTLRFEDLTDISGAALEELAAFVGHRGAIAPWVNPFDELSKVEPGFFRKGSTEFAADEEWPELAENLFRYVHGDLLERLGYARRLQSPVPAEWTDLFRWVRDLVERSRFLARTCDERLSLIHRLSEEAQRRLDIIHELSPTRQVS
jgi:hypothetical protein